MKKYIIVFVNLFTFCLLSTITYRPMTKRTKDFGEDVCYYKDVSDSSNLVYVKPCEEGKRCVDLQISDYDIHTCVAYDGTYNNKDSQCVTKDNVDYNSNDDNYANGIDCTKYSCFEDICGKKPSGSCSENQVMDELDSNKCVEEKEICKEFDSNGIPTKSYTPGLKKKCVRLVLQTNDNGKTYSDKTIYSNAIASIDDGEFIKEDNNIRENILTYCKSGYALYFYGNKNLNNPNPDDHTKHEMYLRCVTVKGRDSNGVIKYVIGDGGENYYDPDKLPYKTSTGLSRYTLYYDDEFLMTRIEMFENFVKNINDENESAKWLYFYKNPEEYLLYKDEPQIIEYLIKEEDGNIKYKVKHTASKESSNLLNIKYMISLLALLLLF